MISEAEWIAEVERVTTEMEKFVRRLKRLRRKEQNATLTKAEKSELKRMEKEEKQMINKQMDFIHSPNLCTNIALAFGSYLCPDNYWNWRWINRESGVKPELSPQL